MRNKTIIYTFCALLFSFSATFAQLAKVPLRYDSKRNVKASSPSVGSRQARIQAVTTDTISPLINISIASGQNPVCKSDGAIAHPFTFRANTINGGTSPVFQWFVDNVAQTANTPSFSANLLSGQQVYCSLTSSLSCIKPLSDISNIITITGADSLKPSGAIQILAGDNPSCSVKSSLTLLGVLLNAGTETGQNLQWYLNDSLTNVTGPLYTSDSLPDKSYIYFKFLSSLTCAKPDTIITSAPFTRSIPRSITPSASLNLDSITIDGACSKKIYNFSASPVNGGANPNYAWYVKNVLVSTTSGIYFSTNTLDENGDEVNVAMASSLVCSNTKSVSSSVFQRTDTIALPFFDDFSISDISPSKNLWVKNGGTYINNTYCVKPPTYNAATFDGMQYNGTPYDTLSNISRGVTDNLTSIPIDLSDSLLNTNVYISFFWQPQGLGEPPDSAQGDNLSLYFKNSDQQWILMWRQGGILEQDFTQEIVQVANSGDTNFFHKGFQFKFETTGRLSGSFDVWNLDYIYLNRNRSASDLYFNDQAFSAQPGFILKRYSAMPVWQFLKNPAGEIKDTVLSSINNLSSSKNNISYKIQLLLNGTDAIPPPFDTTFRINESEKDHETILNLKRFDFSGIPSVKTEIYTTFSLKGDSINSDGKGLDYRINNQITSKTILDNFLAYDDGSAEYGIAMNQKFALVAYRFILNSDTVPDTLRQIAIYFTKLGTILSSDASLNLFVSDKLPTQGELNQSVYPAHIYYNENQLVKYPTIIDNYSIYELPEPIILKDTIYIGYKQISDDKVTIGWDVNTDASQHMFQMIDFLHWIPYDGDPGSMMIRPVFGQYHYATDVTGPKEKPYEDINLYPNPTTGVINIGSDFKKATVYDIIGSAKAVFPGNQPMDISHLPEGIYFIRVETNNKISFTKKIILAK